MSEDIKFYIFMLVFAGIAIVTGIFNIFINIYK